jgi:CheY-like chemotaxis protein
VVATAFDKNVRVGDAKTPRLRVVVADDDPDAILTLTLLLEDEGHQVRAVKNGQQALYAVRDFGADVVLLDIGMPGMTGYEVAQTLRQRYGSAKPALVAVTGRNSESDKSLSQSTGFDHHVAKPYEPNALLALIERVGSLR